MKGAKPYHFMTPFILEAFKKILFTKGGAANKLGEKELRVGNYWIYAGGGKWRQMAASGGIA